ncbi:MAG: HAMP domain-containing histidine kinase [Oscillospiraceae bacterium]|nr:HAMP domain-containing histidine kinase [Oscillospiraceae bacterium]
MNLFRNKEIKVFLFHYLLLATAASVAASFISVWAVILIFGVCVMSALLFIVFTGKRYQAISDLNAKIDGILHGESNISLIPDEEGELAVLCSELSKMTLRMRDQADRLEKDKRYLSDSLADISHQLRTPLTSIRMLVSGLANEEQSTGQQAKVRKVNTLLDRTEWMIATLLKIARLESGTVQFSDEFIPIDSLINDTLEPLEILMDIKNIHLSCDIKNNAGFTGDRLWSTEAIGNILKNCIEHCPNGGKLEIHSTENPLYTEVIISDNGTGFDEKDIPHLFDRFYRGSNSTKESAGIGLNLSRMIISKLNGVITAANKACGGAQFTIRIYKGAI